jgi:hypothetical protein
MIALANHGSLILVTPDDADYLPFADWLADHVGEDALFYGDALAVEPRFVAALVDGLVAAGFAVHS